MSNYYNAGKGGQMKETHALIQGGQKGLRSKSEHN